jgi:hypothetical protein
MAKQCAFADDYAKVERVVFNALPGHAAVPSNICACDGFLPSAGGQADPTFASPLAEFAVAPLSIFLLRAIWSPASGPKKSLGVVP